MVPPLPRPLVAGDRVQVISPSGPSDPEEVARGRERWTVRYDVRHPQASRPRTGFLAGTDADRARELMDALADPETRALVCTRGGHGALRLLEIAGEHIVEAARTRRIPVVGFSDITVLHQLWRHAGVPSLHAPMLAAVGGGRVRAEDVDETFRALEAATPEPWRGLETVVAGAAEGSAAGGNLAVLAALCGTRWTPRFDGCIAFLEDVGERPYRVDRLLTQLRTAGAFVGVRGIVLGDFTDCGPGPDGVAVEQVLADAVAGLGVPVVRGAPFGHGTRHRPWWQGARATIEAGTVAFGRVHGGDR